MNSVYVNLDGHEICLEHLDSQERKLLARIFRRAESHPDWTDFDNFRFRVVPEFYDGRGLTRKASRQTTLYRIAEDLSSRLGIAAGLVRMDDYRDELEHLISDKFTSRRAFCNATGLSEDMLSHVIAGRKDLSLGSLTKALQKIGYRLRIVPVPQISPAKQRRIRTG